METYLATERLPEVGQVVHASLICDAKFDGSDWRDANNGSVLPGLLTEWWPKEGLRARESPG